MLPSSCVVVSPLRVEAIEAARFLPILAYLRRVPARSRLAAGDGGVESVGRTHSHALSGAPEGYGLASTKLGS